MKKEKKVWAITLVAFWWLAPNETFAQQDSLNTVNLSEVVITATKFPKNQSETGKVLTIIDREQLDKSEGKDLSQVLNEQVGLVVNGANSNSGKDKSVYLRGATNSYTLILLDGIPLNDPSGVSGGAYDLRLVSIDQIERIEILKGSQSTLYGSDAIAGVINIITKKGGDKPVEGFASASYGSYATLRGNVGVRGSSSAFDYNMGYTRYHTDGISEARDASGAGNFDNDGYDQNSLQANLTVRPTDALSLSPFVRYADFDGKYDAGALTDDVNNKYQASLLNMGGRAQYRLKKGAVNLLYAYDKTKRKFEDTYGLSEYEGRFTNTDVFVNHDLAKNFQGLAGINFQQWKMIDTTAMVENPDINLTSAYLSLFVRDVGNFAMEIGGRYNQHSKYGDNITYSVNPSFMIRKQFKLFLNYSTGYKAPSLYQLYGLYGANPDLKPEISSTAEGGVQWFSLDKKLDLRVVTFKRQVKDIIIYGIGPNGNGINSNFDQQDDYGVDVEITVRIKKLSLSGTYAFVTGEVKTRTFDNQDTTYNNLIRRPKHSFGINLGYPISKNLSVSVNLKEFGERKDLYFDLATFETKTATLNPYALLDVHINYQPTPNKVSLFADFRNILKQDYEEVFGYSTMGFNFTVGAALKL